MWITNIYLRGILIQPSQRQKEEHKTVRNKHKCKGDTHTDKHKYRKNDWEMWITNRDLRENLYSHHIDREKNIKVCETSTNLYTKTGRRTDKCGKQTKI